MGERFSIVMEEELRDKIDEVADNRSEWIRDACKQKLGKEHDSLENLTDRVNELENALIQAAVHGGEPGEYLPETTTVYEAPGGKTTKHDPD